MAVSASEVRPPCRLFRGHKDSVNCICLNSEGTTLLSGGDDAALLGFDTRSAKAVMCISETFKGDPVTSVAFLPGKDHHVVAAAGRTIYSFDLRSLPGDGAPGAVIQEVTFSKDEINSVAVNAKGTFLAASDDSGEVKIVNLSTWKLHKSLHGGHTSICSSACFHPKKPWEVFSGGLDCQTIKWDFSSGRPLHAWSSTGSISGQQCNPPFVNSIAVHWGEPIRQEHETREYGRAQPSLNSGGDGKMSHSASSSTADEGHVQTGSSGNEAGVADVLDAEQMKVCLGREEAFAGKPVAGVKDVGVGKVVGRALTMIALGKGGGGIAVYNADWKASAPPPPAAVAAKTKKSKQKSKGSGARVGVAEKTDKSKEEGHGDGGCLGHLGSTVPGICSKGLDICGHRAAVSDISLRMGPSDSSLLLLSGGNDANVCLWDVSRCTQRKGDSISPLAPLHLCPLMKLSNTKKVNRVLLGNSSGSRVTAYVADVSPIVKCFTLQM